MEKVLLFFETIRLIDAADILLNSYIIFRLYVLFRGTTVFRVLMGIAILWFFQRAAILSGLIVTSWVFEGITAAAAFLIIVVFRNEIRSVLQAKNLGAILWGFPQRGIHTPIETIVESVYEMAHRHTGALIVFPGKEDLKEYTHSGISWQGLLSKEMIMSVFWPDNPVHDGAAIIEGDQITEVGTVLPLSRRTDFPSQYGTRHRAAAGLAESTDALVIVASEEKGNVAVAKGNRLRVLRGKKELSRMLVEHLGIQVKQEGIFNKGTLQLGIAGLLSLAFISGVWFSFTRGLDSLVTFEVPVEYMNRGTEMEILEASVNAVRLDLSGSGALIKSITPERLQVRIDLSKAIPGTNTFTITQDNITLPPGINLKQVMPVFVEVTLDVSITKTLPVQVDWVGKLAANLILKESRITPGKTQIIGGGRILKTISTIYTEKVDLDKIKKSGTMEVKLALNPASLKIAPDSKDKVTVEYVVEERQKK
ncbi:diadenylate cyclase [Thermodesulfobacteriota bacterium]